MTTPLRTRVYAMTVTVLVCVVGSGACFGFLLDGWAGAAVGAGAASLGAGFGMLVRPRPTVTSVQAARGDGYAEGIADVVLLSIATYEAAVFPLTSDGVAMKNNRPVAPSRTGSPPTTDCPVPFACRRRPRWRLSTTERTPNVPALP
ncbi:hypothetical protein [Streptomyces lincolnensis]|uniref:hypothetical protein n=1 Tax=Streptomyces lincolnensis TaxID=1915 RepID=UPI00126029A1|nr:hypothetical protein [Streptomyces lincolnensis]QMV04314.1 hypothetical protein GJU35_00485 [Streptomyces lincolnensis]QMV12009.1 hypothetical protein GJU35_44435 [Streptomyces lincolnensis]